MIFWNSAEISLVFCQCKRSLQSRRYYSGFWSRGTWPSAESPDRGPRRNAHYTCTVKGREKSRMRTTYQNTSMRFRFFRACAFRAKNPECYGFFWQCKRYNKKTQVFWILVFANVNGPNSKINMIQLCSKVNEPHHKINKFLLSLSDRTLFKCKHFYFMMFSSSIMIELQFLSHISNRIYHFMGSHSLVEYYVTFGKSQT